MLEFGRRDVMAAMAAGAALGSASSAIARKTNAKPLDFSNQDDRFRAFMQMRGALDERLVIGYCTGAYFGVVDGQMTPLWDVVGVTFARFRRRPDGSYDGVSGEIAHFLDPKTGEAPGRFFNPYTGKTITEPRRNLPPSRILVLPDHGVSPARDMPGATFDHELRAPQVRGDDVWISEINRVTMQPPGGTKPFSYNEVVTMHASLKELQQPGAMRVTCPTSVTITVDWRPWMEMPAGHPGHLLMASTSGGYGVSMDELPETWLKATRQHFPQMLEDPASLIEPLWKTL